MLRGAMRLIVRAIMSRANRVCDFDRRARFEIAVARV
jgi:hypothetical protein